VLVIANGAAKSGSTWLFNIISEIDEFERPPAEFLLDQKNVNPEIQYDKLRHLLDSLDYSDRHYLIKNHFNEPEQRDLILSCPHAYVLDIERDLRDVVVSSYFHNLRESSYDGPFKKYYWQRGRWQADIVRTHHQVWKQSPNSKMYLSSFDRLKKNFSNEVRQIANFLGRKITDHDIKRIEEATSIRKLRRKYNDDGDIKFFRKGISGEWQEFFTRSMIRDIEKIEQCGIDGLSFFEKKFPLIKKKLYDHVL